MKRRDAVERLLSSEILPSHCKSCLARWLILLFSLFQLISLALLYEWAESSSNGRAQADAVSAITPVTGLPPDSPARVASLSPLLLNVPPSGHDEVSVLTGMNSPTGTPMKGTWNQSGEDITVYEDNSKSARGSESPISHLLQSGRPNDRMGRRSSKISALAKSSVSRFTQSEYFSKLVDKSFASVDVDKSGDVTLEELYAGLLLIHLNMAKYVGSPACRVRRFQHESKFRIGLNLLVPFLASLPARNTSLRSSHFSTPTTRDH